MKAHSERGSAIIMLFVAVALFGAITYAFLQGSRGSVNLMSSQQAEAYAQNLIGYSNDLRSGVKRLKLRGCADKEISFENSYAAGYGNLYNAPDTCKLFHPAGGGLKWLVNKDLRVSKDQVTTTNGYQAYFLLDNENYVFVYPLYNDTYDNGTASGTSDAVDLIAVAPFIKKEVCEAINNKLGLAAPAPASSLPGFNNFGTKFRGSYVPYASPASPGKTQQICFYTDLAGMRHYLYYALLIGR